MRASNLVERLPKLLDDELEQRRLECVGRMATAFRSAFDSSIDEGAARSIFEIYRKFDLKTARAGQNSTDIELRTASSSLVADIASVFQGIPQAALHHFVDQHWGLYKEERATLFAARSRSSHVAAVLRPFHKRYSEAFVAVLNNESKANEFRTSIDGLLQTTISSQLDLEDWWHKVWVLFSSLAVYNGDKENDRPLGMIGPGSVRTYRQQWNSWFNQNKSSLVQLGSLEPVKSQPSRNSEIAVEEAFSKEQLEVESVAHGSQLLSEVRLTVSKVAGDISITRNWPAQQEIVRTNLRSWIDSLQHLLESESSTLQLGLGASNGEEELSVSFTADSAEFAADKTIRIISAFQS